jgi:hypothetical protein
MNDFQLIAAICRKQGLPFTLGQADNLVTLCREFSRRARRRDQAKRLCGRKPRR